MTDTSLPTGVAERNREIIAQRLGWPDGALEACRTLEARHDGCYCWWTPAPWPPPGAGGPAYGAARTNYRPGGRSLYAATPDELADLIEAADKGGQDISRRAAEGKRAARPGNPAHAPNGGPEL